MIGKGRQKISTEYTSEDMLDVQKVVNLVNTSLSQHQYNKIDIDYLVRYRNGDQTILSKIKEIRPEINNRLVLNHAQMITRNIVGYFLGTPIQYIQSGLTESKNEIDMLNKFVAYEDKSSVDAEIGEYQSICGTAYRIVYTDGILADDVPFEDKALNPSTTYVVYENNIAEKPVLAVSYYTLLDDDGGVVGTKVYAYTVHGLYECITDTDGVVTDLSSVTFYPYNVGGIPIIEYPNNMWRIGDWELCIGLMDAINALHSGRLDDIDQVVQSLIVFVNAELDEDEYKEMREAGVIMLNNKTNNPSKVDVLNNSLEQSGMNMFSTELESLLYAILGIPERNNRAGGGGDTGQAVELRDGWADLEIVARNKESVFKKAEKQTLRIILSIMNNRLGTNLSLLDIDVKFSRNKNNNLLVKTQSFETLLRTKTLTPEDCLTIVDLVSDVNEYINRGKTFWGDAFANNVVEKEPITSNDEVEKDVIE